MCKHTSKIGNLSYINVTYVTYLNIGNLCAPFASWANRVSLKLFAQILQLPVYPFYQFCTSYILEVILWGQNRSIKFILLTLHCISGLVSPELYKTVILYAYKTHRHKTLCFIKLSHTKCAWEEKKISVWMSNVTLLRMLRKLQAEK